ncbi:hypothetical protein HMPREF1885_00142 [Streptococcus agalactiae]|nr:hypothetical protein SaSA20_1653 [Streptococcus agalactiae]EPU04854.1 hypothetical protein SAG0123_05565 [Streptococcus agalactiae STIR-CD-13]EPU05341.1 hypothetical protein SAG0122_07025 [Streptococcus agalactiae STIR-CD-09]EPW87109.1 hypothetical protein SAG0121_08190 [Streptococcus agalactiae STIR-CD-07]KXA60475.1 hypothetical protein HMPREF1885_00142 [Streptococcus agalactiae]
MTNISEVNFYLTIVLINAVLPLINRLFPSQKGIFFSLFFSLFIV